MKKDGMPQDDLAQLLGISVRTLRIWRRERRGPTCEFNGLQPWYPLTRLVPWLKRHRPDIDLTSSVARYRRAKAAEQEQKTETDVWEEFFQEGERLRRRDQAYAEACRLDDRGESAEADRILLVAGVARDVVERRRRYVNFQAAKNGHPRASEKSRGDRSMG
jgi:hypothetical protein